MTRAIGAFVLTLCACAIDLAPLPVARVRASPTSIPEGDGYATVVTLDASGSRDEFAPTAMNLRYSWRLDASARLESSDQDPVIHVRFAGDHPPEATLTVSARDGRAATVSIRVALTVRP